jgi:hypothetical protein
MHCTLYTVHRTLFLFLFLFLFFHSITASATLSLLVPLSTHCTQYTLHSVHTALTLHSPSMARFHKPWSHITACKKLVDEGLPLDPVKCAPVPFEWTDQLEMACVLTFSIEYAGTVYPVCTVCTVYSALRVSSPSLSCSAHALR